MPGHQPLRSRARSALPLLYVACLTACRTTALVDPAPISVPDGLSLSDLEVALAAPLRGRPDPSEFSDELLAAYVWVEGEPSSQWAFQSKETGALTILYQKNLHVLVAIVAYDEKSVRPRIRTSQNLLQTESSIHKAAYEWLSHLADDLHTSLVRVQQIEKTTLFDESVRILKERDAQQMTPVLRAVFNRASRSGPGSYEYDLLREALPSIKLEPSQLVDPVGDIYPDYVDAALGDWFDTSLKLLRSRSRGDSPEVLRDVFHYARQKGPGSPEEEELRAALPELNLSRSELSGIVGDAYPSYAKETLAEIDLLVTLDTHGDRLLRDDLEKALSQVSPAIRFVREGQPSEVTLSVARLQWDEHDTPERTQTITYSRNEVNVWNAVLTMPDYSSYQYEHTAGEASIDYAFEVRISAGDKVIVDDLVRDRVGRTYSFCRNARVQNAFGGSQPAGFIANSHMQELCGQDSSPVRAADLRGSAVSELANAIAEVSEIRAELARYSD